MGYSSENIRETLLKLDPADNSHWTKEGLPALHAVASTGQIWGVKRSEITAAGPSFRRDNRVFEFSIEIQAGKTQEEEAFSSQEPSSDRAPQSPLQLAEARVSDALRKLEQAKLDLARAEAERDRVLEENESAVHPHQNQIDIMEFLAGQKAMREARLEKAKDLIGLLKMPIDKAMARRSGFGQARPKLPHLG